MIKTKYMLMHDQTILIDHLEEEDLIAIRNAYFELSEAQHFGSTGSKYIDLLLEIVYIKEGTIRLSKEQARDYWYTHTHILQHFVI